jgi:ribosome-binding protein aMBF1 (putative translation factor)
VIASNGSGAEKQEHIDLDSREAEIQRLRRSRMARERFVESHLSKGLAFQIRSLREREEWSQQKLADQIESNQNAIYRAENPNYDCQQTLSTLRKIAAAFDVGLMVRFVPFSELLDWTTSTPRIIKGLSTELCR